MNHSKSKEWEYFLYKTLIFHSVNNMINNTRENNLKTSEEIMTTKSKQESDMFSFREPSQKYHEASLLKVEKINNFQVIDKPQKFLPFSEYKNTTEEEKYFSNSNSKTMVNVEIDNLNEKLLQFKLKHENQIFLSSNKKINKSPRFVQCSTKKRKQINHEGSYTLRDTSSKKSKNNETMNLVGVNFKHNKKQINFIDLNMVKDITYTNIYKNKISSWSPSREFCSSSKFAFSLGDTGKKRNIKPVIKEEDLSDVEKRLRNYSNNKEIFFAPKINHNHSSQVKPFPRSTSANYIVPNRLVKTCLNFEEKKQSEPKAAIEIYNKSKINPPENASEISDKTQLSNSGINKYIDNLKNIETDEGDKESTLEKEKQSKPAKKNNEKNDFIKQSKRNICKRGKINLSDFLDNISHQQEEEKVNKDIEVYYDEGAIIQLSEKDEEEKQKETEDRNQEENECQVELINEEGEEDEDVMKKAIESQEKQNQMMEKLNMLFKQEEEEKMLLPKKCSPNKQTFSDKEDSLSNNGLDTSLIIPESEVKSMPRREEDDKIPFHLISKQKIYSNLVKYMYGNSKMKK